MRAVQAVHVKMAAHVLMCLGHSSVNAQGNSLALDAKKVCLQTEARSLTDQTTRRDRIQLLTTIFGWFSICVFHLRLVHRMIVFSTENEGRSVPLGNIDQLKTNLLWFKR